MRLCIVMIAISCLAAQEQTVPCEHRSYRVVDVLSEHGIDIEKSAHVAFIDGADGFAYPDGFQPAGGTVVRIYRGEQEVGWIEALNIPSKHGATWGFSVRGGATTERGRQVIRFRKNTAAIQWSISINALHVDSEATP